MRLDKTLLKLGQFTLLALTVSTASLGQAEDLPAAIQAKVDKGLKDLTTWAADPAVVNAAKVVNGKKGIAGMTNSKWEEMTATDGAVTAILTSPVSQKLAGWEKSGGYQKLLLRDSEAYFVAGSEKPLLYNNATRPQFKVPSEGKDFFATSIKPDPTTQVKSVQIGVPVKDGGKVVGVLHAAVTVD